MLIWVHRHINIFVHSNTSTFVQHIDILGAVTIFWILRANSQNVPPQKVCHNLTASGSETALIQSPFHTTGSIESTAVEAGTSVWFQPLTKPPCVTCDRPVPATAWIGGPKEIFYASQCANRYGTSESRWFGKVKTAQEHAQPQALNL